MKRFMEEILVIYIFASIDAVIFHELPEDDKILAFHEKKLFIVIREYPNLKPSNEIFLGQKLIGQCSEAETYRSYFYFFVFTFSNYLLCSFLSSFYSALSPAFIIPFTRSRTKFSRQVLDVKQ
jgi:hypothetical protein